MRSLDPILKARQDSAINKPYIEVWAKPSESSNDNEYVDLTDYVVNFSINRNLEGEPNTASIDVECTLGKYDLFNLLSAERKKLMKFVKVKIYAGFKDDTDKQLLFTGYVTECPILKYEVGEQEIVTVTLQDRSCMLDYPIDTQEYGVNTITWSTHTLEEILTDVLTVHGKLQATDFDVDQLSSIIVNRVQFTQETVWDIIKLCAQAKNLAAYFDERGKLQLIDLPQVASPYGTSATVYIDQEPTWSDNDLKSRITVIGGLAHEETRAPRTVVEVNPNEGVRDYKDNFDSQTGTAGNSQYDSLYYDPTASGDDRQYGIGFQGTCVGVDITSHDLTIKENKKRESYPDNGWKITCQGPFPWTTGVDAISGEIFPFPNEPYQDPKTGIADDGDTGYFSIYNANGGTNMVIDPETLTSKYNGMQDNGVMIDFWAWWYIIKVGGGEIYSGILPSKEDWFKYMAWYSYNIPYPDPFGDGRDLGPTATEFWVFTICWCPSWYPVKDSNGHYTGTQSQPYDRMIYAYGMEYEADEIFIEEHYTGTAEDSSIESFFGTKYDEEENELLFSYDDCAYLATKILDNLKIFSNKLTITVPLNLEYQEGDNVDFYNERNGCTYYMCITSIDYNYEGRGERFTMELRGGIQTVNGTTIRLWE